MLNGVINTYSSLMKVDGHVDLTASESAGWPSAQQI